MRPSYLRAALRGIVPAAFALVATLSSAAAQCAGVNLLEQMMPEDVVATQARADAQPYASGNFWSATKEGQRITVVGTYHLDDPRHTPVLSGLLPELAQARSLLVEAGREEEAALLRAMADNPSLMFITQGPTLLERLPRDTWRRLSEALEARGIPAILASKLQPWYATVVLAIPPCQLTTAQPPEGLDGQLMDAAETLGVPVRALEPFDTLFDIFGALDDAQSLAMIESTLALEGQSEDFAVTLADLYFAGESRMIWELTRFFSYDQPGYTAEEVDAEMAMMEELMMTRRNQAWLPVIEAAAAEGPVMAAFGALHLSGEQGVLNLLQGAGWQITPMPLDLGSTAP